MKVTRKIPDIALNIPQTPGGTREKMDRFNFMKDILKSSRHKNSINRKDKGINFGISKYRKTIHVMVCPFSEKTCRRKNECTKSLVPT